MEVLERVLTKLDEPEWQSRKRAHEARIRRWTDPHQERQSRGEKHPVHDFLFTYYSFRPSWLKQWHPGPGVALGGKGAEEFLRWPEYAREPAFAGPTAGRRGTGNGEQGVAIDLARMSDRMRTYVVWLRDFLAAVQSRPAFFGCAGAHEWAMVYKHGARGMGHGQSERRHAGYPLRFPEDEVARIVERLPICCTHFDAFRFFTEAARPLNRIQPTRETAIENDQRGCLHANMDLYKWAFKLAPFVPSELLADCFELAAGIREVDMRASPYDLASLGYAPIKVEMPEGRAEYETHQRDFARRSEPLRARLISLCNRLTSNL